jgi:phospholipid/cholesterol/gamma-HCH transport system permease protein
MAVPFIRMPAVAACRRTSGRTERDDAISTPRDIAVKAERVTAERSSAGDLTVRLSGSWKLHDGIPSPRSVQDAIAKPPMPRRVIIDASAIEGWDSSLPSFLNMLADYCNTRGISIARETLPDGVKRLMALAEAVPEATDARATITRNPLAVRIGVWALGWADGAGDAVTFVGEVAIALERWVRGRARMRRSDLLEITQACGVNALGIVTLISYLVGVILAFMGAVQLQQFGAAIYVADLVGIGIIREMGAMMTGIIMSGRTGAAFAAQLGTMKVTQEIDALTTMGVSPMEFLVLPRVLALILMMPLLCLYADLMGILGGATVGATMLGISVRTYLQETIRAVTLTGLSEGLLKSTVYGILIALAGCYEGFNCGSNSSAVGDAATRAVVESIVFIVVACGLFAVVFNILGI